MSSFIECHPFLDEENKRLKDAYETVRKLGERYIRTVPGNLVLPISYNKHKVYFKNLQIRNDDVYICTFPKSGTTWTQELVWLIQHDSDFHQAKTVELERRSPFIEFQIVSDVIKGHLPPSCPNSIREIEQLPSPRILKSHLRFCLLPDNLLDKCKVVICMRNPKDTVVSYFHHEKRTNYRSYVGDFQTYFDLFMDNLVIWSSYFDYICQAWERRHHPNVCILYYEDMKKDQASSVKKVAKFLGKDLIESQIDQLVEHLSFKNMKNNPAVNKKDANTVGVYKNDSDFMREGEVGDWKNYFTDEMNKRMDEAIEKYFKPIGLEFQYD